MMHVFVVVIITTATAAGNASGISDGAGAIVLASEAASSKHNLKPIARVLGYHISGKTSSSSSSSSRTASTTTRHTSYAGVDPTIMGYGPVPAIRGVPPSVLLSSSPYLTFVSGLLKSSGLTVDQVHTFPLLPKFPSETTYSRPLLLQIDLFEINEAFAGQCVQQRACCACACA